MLVFCMKKMIKVPLSAGASVKKFLVLSALLLVTVTAFADVSVKALKKGKVEVTFTYSDSTASAVYVAGSFNGWQNGAEEMERADTGFVLTKIFDKDDTFTYKFIVDGLWKTDWKAPLLVDDEFGGKNSKVDIATLLGDGAEKLKKAKKTKAKKAKK